MREHRRGDAMSRALLTLAALLPYWHLLTFSVVFITDDYFASDIFNGELPGRVLAGQSLRAGRLPLWTSQLCSGFPLAGAPADPIGLALFTLLPPAPALDALVIVLLLVAAHGAYGLARRFGSDRAGGVLAGVAFAGSGYIACQLKHLSIVSTVVWLPVGLLVIDRALDPAGSRARRSTAAAVFGLVFAEQVLCGFPQSAYICALTYGAFALFRALTASSRESRTVRNMVRVLSGLGLASVLGAASGAVIMLPLSALGSISDRAEGLSYSWSTRLAYWVPNLKTFLIPYIHGDISNNTYIGPPFFWEDYGYVGALTFVLALYAAYRERRRPIAVFTFAMTLVAYFFVLGQATPVFSIAYWLIPGLKLFRFPTRFLVVVELGLALLAAMGLTRVREDLARRWPRPAIPMYAAIAICALTALDLFVHQPRQNPMVPAREWLAPPASVEIVRTGGTPPRTFSPRHRDAHRRTFQLAHGWTDVAPYLQLRDVLAPNLGGGFWGVPSGDCYVGISPRWFVDVWGDHNRELSLMSFLAAYDFEAGVLRISPKLPGVLRAYGVTHMLSSFPAQGAALPLAGRTGNAYIYRIDGAARVRLVGVARHVTDQEAAQRLLDPGFDADREVLLHDAPASARPLAGEAVETAAGPGRAAITKETQREIVVEAASDADGFLLLADTFYPGWSAEVDGKPVPLYRANLSVRAIQLPKGQHVVRFAYEAPGFARGLQITLLAVSLLIAWAGGTAYAGRRARL
jgi:membrane protein YfhO